MKKMLLPLSLALLALAGCAAPTLTPLSDAGQAVSYQQGRATTVSRRAHSTVVISLVTPEVDDHAVLLVSALNRSGAAVNLGTENVTATSGGNRLHVFSARQLARNEKIANVFARIGTGMAAGARSYAANQPTRTEYGGNVYVAGAGQLPVASYTATATTYDPARAALAQSAINADTQAQLAYINAATASRMNEINAVLQTTTVLPGGVAGGVVEINNTGMGSVVSVRVDFAGDEHVFRFRLSR